VLERLSQADVVVGVVTGNNANVIFEIGAAASQLILIVDDPDKLPFDLKGYRSISYGRPGELETLTARIVDALRQTLEARAGVLDSPIEEYLAAIEQQTRVMSYLLPEWLTEKFEGRPGADLRQAYVSTRLQALS